MAFCDCCGRDLTGYAEIPLKYLEKRQFHVCEECKQKLDMLDRPAISFDDYSVLSQWIKRIIPNEIEATEKQRIVANILYSYGDAAAGYFYKKKVDAQNTAAENNVLQTSEQDYSLSSGGSIWTIVIKTLSIFEIMIFSILGGFLGYRFFDSGGIGVLVGLIVGFVFVSGQMMIVKIADDIANSSRNLETVLEILIENQNKKN